MPVLTATASIYNGASVFDALGVPLHFDSSSPLLNNQLLLTKAQASMLVEMKNP
jgi:hypothetical protein